MQSRVAAIVVTFHPRPEHLHNLALIRPQADVLVVVDNGSESSGLSQLRLASQTLSFSLIQNGTNLGIAAALNLGIREAQRQSCRWVALFDQDSTVTDGFVATMVGEFEKYREQHRILQIIPRYRDPVTGTERSVSKYGDGGAFLTITSGSLFSMDAFEQCGWFEESLFIYCVDDEYSLRIRKCGFYIGVSNSAILVHESGKPTYLRIFGKTLSTKNYPPEVRYYYARNKVWLLRRYAWTFPRLIGPTLRELLFTPIKIALMEHAPCNKIWHFLHGLVDGFLCKMGPFRRAT